MQNFGTKAALSAATLPAGIIVSTKGYYDGWAASLEPQGAGSYYIALLADIRTTKGDGAWVPDGNVNFYIANAGNTHVAMLRHNGSVQFKQAGMVPDASTDNLAIMVSTLAMDHEVKHLVDDGGVYAFSDGFDVPEHKTIVGAAAPVMGPFPPPAAQTDDLIYMTPGYKDRIPGTVFLFTGTGTTSGTTTRSDAFITGFSYAVRIDGRTPGRLKNCGIVMDMNVFATFGGSVTSVAADARSDYDVGLFVDGAGASAFENVTVFGYWKISGTVVYNGPIQADGGDPDYMKFKGLSTSGERGLSIINNEDNGFTGLGFVECKLYCNDHHARSIVDNQWGTNALYIDGTVTGSSTGINGITFLDTDIRSSVDNIIALDHCDNVKFLGGVLENPAFAGSTGATLSQITGTANTGNVQFNMRMARDGISTQLRTQMAGVLVWDNEYPTGAQMIARGDNVIRLVHDSSTGDIVIQLADSPSSINSGWTLRVDQDQSDRLDVRFDNVSLGHITTVGRANLNNVGVGIFGVPFGSLLTISGGAITPTASRHKITAEGGPGVDTLPNIVATNFVAGDRLILSTDNAADSITLLDNTVNLRLAGDFLMDSVFDRIELEYDGSNWVELSRSNNA